MQCLFLRTDLPSPQFLLFCSERQLWLLMILQCPGCIQLLVYRSCENLKRSLMGRYSERKLISFSKTCQLTNRLLRT